MEDKEVVEESTEVWVVQEVDPETVEGWVAPMVDPCTTHKIQPVVPTEVAEAAEEVQEEVAEVDALPFVLD